MINLKPYYQVKLTLYCRCMSYFINNPPKTEDKKYAYEIIPKAYWINEKKIGMRNSKKDKQLTNKGKILLHYFLLFLPTFTHLFTVLSQQKTHFCLPTKVRFLN